MNKYGILSILMVVINIIVFFIEKGPNANLILDIIILSAIAIVGLVFAILSKKWLAITVGVILNGFGLIFAYLLLLAVGIGGPKGFSYLTFFKNWKE